MIEPPESVKSLFREYTATLSISESVVKISCDDRDEAEELFNWLESLFGEDE